MKGLEVPQSRYLIPWDFSRPIRLQGDDQLRPVIDVARAPSRAHFLWDEARCRAVANGRSKRRCLPSPIPGRPGSRGCKLRRRGVHAGIGSTATALPPTRTRVPGRGNEYGAGGVRRAL